MAYDIGPTIGIDGEAQFRQAISNINTNLKTLGTEMEAVSSKYDKNDKSQEALTAQNQVLNKQIDAQRQKLAELQKGLDAAAGKYGENEKVTQGWKQAVNHATAELNKMENQLKENNSTLDNYGKEADQATEKTNKLHTALGKVGTGLKGIGGVVGKAAVAGIAAVGAAATAAAAGAWKMATSSADYADEVQKSADVTGLSAERVQELTYAGKNLGVEFDTIAGAQAKLTKAMDASKGGTGKQAEAFKALGISVLDANGNLRNSQDVMNEAFTKLNSVGNETERDALAMQLFGKSAMELNPLIKAGGDELNRLTQEARENGAVLSGEQIAALDAFGDSIENLKASGQGLAANITTAILPALNGLIGNVKNVTKEIGTAVKTGDWSQVGVAISDGLNSIISQLSGMLPKLANMASTIIGGLASALVNAIPQVLPPLIQATLQLLDVLIKIFVDNGSMLLNAGIDAVMMIIDGIVEALPKFLDAAVKLIVRFVDKLIEITPKLIDAAVSIMFALVDGILDLLPELIPLTIEVIVALAKGLIEALPKLIEKLPQIVQTIVDVIIEYLPWIIDAAIEIIITLTKTILENIPLIIEAALKIMGALLKAFISFLPEIALFVPRLFDELWNSITSINWAELGLNIITGIVDGVVSAAKNIANAVVNAARSALDAAKNFFGIQSPSTVMRDQVGKMIGLGMAEGIADSAKQVDAAMNKLNKGLTTDVSVNGSTSAGMAYFNVPLSLDGQIITRKTGTVQVRKNQTYSRAIGVMA
jgi:TP901 family phage tail tape measure protein